MKNIIQTWWAFNWGDHKVLLGPQDCSREGAPPGLWIAITWFFHFSVLETRSNGAILGTPVSLKATVGLSHPTAASLLPSLNIKKGDSSFWIDGSKNKSYSSETW